MENLVDPTGKLPLPSVALDGTKIRTIREAQKLTQLYVATVVGVTTDTISRWENNRSPSIKRDNAEKLAAALEVELNEILRPEEPPAEPSPPEEPGTPPPPRSRRWLPLLVAALLLTATAAGFLLGRQVATPAAVRQLPRYGAPGMVIPVQLKVRVPEGEARGLIVKERLPAGWQLVSAAPPVAATPLPGGEVKWLLPGGTSIATLSYTVRVPPGSAVQTPADFAGTVVADLGEQTRQATVAGDRTVTVAGSHWADRNADGRIDDNEIMPAYYLTEEMKGLGLDWKAIEAIWSAKGYRWEGAGQGFTVLR